MVVKLRNDSCDEEIELDFYDQMIKDPKFVDYKVYNDDKSLWFTNFMVFKFIGSDSDGERFWDSCEDELETKAIYKTRNRMLSEGENSNFYQIIFHLNESLRSQYRSKVILYEKLYAFLCNRLNAIYSPNDTMIANFNNQNDWETIKQEPETYDSYDINIFSLSKKYRILSDESINTIKESKAFYYYNFKNSSNIYLKIVDYYRELNTWKGLEETLDDNRVFKIDFADKNDAFLSKFYRKLDETLKTINGSKFNLIDLGTLPFMYDGDTCLMKIDSIEDKNLCVFVKTVLLTAFECKENPLWILENLNSLLSEESIERLSNTFSYEGSFFQFMKSFTFLYHFICYNSFKCIKRYPDLHLGTLSSYYRYLYTLDVDSFCERFSLKIDSKVEKRSFLRSYGFYFKSNNIKLFRKYFLKLVDDGLIDSSTLKVAPVSSFQSFLHINNGEACRFVKIVKKYISFVRKEEMIKEALNSAQNAVQGNKNGKIGFTSNIRYYINNYSTIIVNNINNNSNNIYFNNIKT